MELYREFVDNSTPKKSIEHSFRVSRHLQKLDFHEEATSFLSQAHEQLKDSDPDSSQYFKASLLLGRARAMAAKQKFDSQKNAEASTSDLFGKTELAAVFELAEKEMTTGLDGLAKNDFPTKQQDKKQQDKIIEDTLLLLIDMNKILGRPEAVTKWQEKKSANPKND